MVVEEVAVVFSSSSRETVLVVVKSHKHKRKIFLLKKTFFMIFIFETEPMAVSMQFNKRSAIIALKRRYEHGYVPEHRLVAFFGNAIPSRRVDLIIFIHLPLCCYMCIPQTHTHTQKYISHSQCLSSSAGAHVRVQALAYVSCVSWHCGALKGKH